MTPTQKLQKQAFDSGVIKGRSDKKKEMMKEMEPHIARAYEAGQNNERIVIGNMTVSALKNEQLRQKNAVVPWNELTYQQRLETVSNISKNQIQVGQINFTG